MEQGAYPDRRAQELCRNYLDTTGGALNISWASAVIENQVWVGLSTEDGDGQLLELDLPPHGAMIVQVHSHCPAGAIIQSWLCGAKRIMTLSLKTWHRGVNLSLTLYLG